MSLQEELRRTADAFAMTGCVLAEKYGKDPKAVTLEALTDAMARLNEHGALGEEPSSSTGELDWSDEG